MQKGIPWTEKYRPKSLDQILSHNNTISILRNFIHNKQLPHLLFHGPSGTGKTSTMMAIARELYGNNIDTMIMVINASEERGIEVIRTKVTDFARSKSMVLKEEDLLTKDLFKLIILDEADAMTYDAQTILRRIIENYSNNVRFCLICNYIKNIHIALQSRCILFKFPTLESRYIYTKIEDISKLEDITISNKGIDTIITRSEGDMRRVLNMLQTVNMAYYKQTITDIEVNNCLGYPDNNTIMNLLDILKNKDFKECYQHCMDLRNNYGYSLSDIINDISKILIESVKDNIEYIKSLALIQYNLSTSVDDALQYFSFIGVFKKN